MKNNSGEEPSKVVRKIISILAIVAGGMMTGYGIADKSILLIIVGLGLILPSQIFIIKKIKKEKGDEN